MPPLERTDLLDSAVVWPMLSRGGYRGIPLQQPYDPYGEPIVVAVPRQIDVRWVGKQTRMLDKDGNAIALDATMVLDEESAEVPVGSIVYHGALEDIAGTGSFTSPENELYQIKMFSTTPDIKNRNNRRTAGLMRFRDAMPAVSATGVATDGD